MTQALLGHGPKQQPLEAALTEVTEHQEVGVLRNLEKGLRRRGVDHVHLHLRGRCVGQEVVHPTMFGGGRR